MMIHTFAGKLREALEARSYRGEIILFYGTAAFALSLLQTWSAIDREGYAHTLVLMPRCAAVYFQHARSAPFIGYHQKQCCKSPSHREQDCRKVIGFEARLGCIWSSDPMPTAVGRARAAAAGAEGFLIRSVAWYYLTYLCIHFIFCLLIVLISAPCLPQLQAVR
jgi:hypothetical protein